MTDKKVFITLVLVHKARVFLVAKPFASRLKCHRGVFESLASVVGSGLTFKYYNKIKGFQEQTL
jgi:hypothetical protein